MSEALTPHLTREQYRERYMLNLGKEIANEAYNLNAVEAYLASGESAADAINESPTLTAGIPITTLKAVNAVKFRETVQNSTAAVQPLSLAEQQFIYTASDAINTMLKSVMRNGKKVTPEYFRQVVSDILREAKGAVPTFRNPLVQDAGEDQDETVLPASNAQVSATQKASDPVKETAANNQSDFKNPVDNTNRNVRTNIFGYEVEDPDDADFQTGYDLDKLFGVGQGMRGGRLIGRNSVQPSVEMKYQRSIRGSGLTAGKKKETKKPLASFGKYNIDLNDLKNSHLTLYTAKGNRQRKVPRQAIGGNVANVLKSIVVGKRPKPKDVLLLNDDEKEYLSGVGIATGLEDLSEMPTKKKTEEQKEMHEFEVLRGQIGAGNDNPKIVKDFKNQLIKMVKAKKVKKHQAHDILLELAALGH